MAYWQQLISLDNDSRPPQGVTGRKYQDILMVKIEVKASVRNLCLPLLAMWVLTQMLSACACDTFVLTVALKKNINPSSEGLVSFFIWNTPETLLGRFLGFSSILLTASPLFTNSIEKSMQHVYITLCMQVEPTITNMQGRLKVVTKKIKKRKS